MWKWLTFVFVFCTIGCTSTSSRKYTFRADRIVLHGSVQKHIRHSLEKVAGVKEIAFDSGKSTVTVMHDGKVVANQVEQAIDHAGMWVGSVDKVGTDTWVAHVRAQEY